MNNLQIISSINKSPFSEMVSFSVIDSNNNVVRELNASVSRSLGFEEDAVWSNWAVNIPSFNSSDEEMLNGFILLLNAVNSFVQN